MDIDVNYETKYFEFINNGLKGTLYDIKKTTTTKEDFFNELVSLTNITKKLNGIIELILTRHVTNMEPSSTRTLRSFLVPRLQVFLLKS